MGIGAIGLGIYSCSNDETSKLNQDIAKNKKIETAQTTTVVLNRGIVILYGGEQYLLEARFKTTESLPKNLEEIQAYFLRDIKKMMGTLEYLSDGEVFYSIDIVNGTEIKSAFFGGAPNPCSFEGIRRCAVKRIDNLNTFEKIICAFTMPDSLLIHMASCAWDNCGIENWIKDYQRQPEGIYR